jgi:hypothetical protein
MPEEVHKVLDPYMNALEQGLEPQPAFPGTNPERAATLQDPFPKR